MGTCCRYLQMPVLHPAYCYSLQTMIFHVFSFHCIFCTTCFFHYTHTSHVTTFIWASISMCVCLKIGSPWIPDSRPLALVDHDFLWTGYKIVYPLFLDPKSRSPWLNHPWVLMVLNGKMTLKSPKKWLGQSLGGFSHQIPCPRTWRTSDGNGIGVEIAGHEGLAEGHRLSLLGLFWGWTIW